MRGRTLFSTTAAALASAIVMLTLVSYVAAKISSDITTQGDQQLALAQNSSAQDTAIHMHAVAVQTQQDRAQLEAVVPGDVAGIVSAIDAVGKAANVRVNIGTATAVDLPAGVSGGLHAISFVVESNGAFTDLMRAAALFETLPVPSVIDQFDFEFLPASTTGGKNQWRLTTRLHALTKADISP